MVIIGKLERARLHFSRTDETTSSLFCIRKWEWRLGFLTLLVTVRGYTSNFSTATAGLIFRLKQIILQAGTTSHQSKSCLPEITSKIFLEFKKEGNTKSISWNVSSEFWLREEMGKENLWQRYKLMKCKQWRREVIMWIGIWNFPL